MSSLVLSTEREQYNVSESFGDDGVIYVWKLLFFIDFLLIERSLLFSDREKWIDRIIGNCSLTDQVHYL